MPNTVLTTPFRQQYHPSPISCFQYTNDFSQDAQEPPLFSNSCHSPLAQSSCLVDLASLAELLAYPAVQTLYEDLTTANRSVRRAINIQADLQKGNCETQ